MSTLSILMKAPIMLYCCGLHEVFMCYQVISAQGELLTKASQFCSVIESPSSVGVKINDIFMSLCYCAGATGNGYTTNQGFRQDKVYD